MKWRPGTSSLLFFILLLALALRIAALIGLRGSVYFDFLLWDEQYYHAWALKIAEGAFGSSVPYRFSPLPAYVHAFIYWILSPDILYVRILHLLLGVLTCWFVYLAGREMADRLTGILASFIAAIYEPLIFYSIVPLKTSLSVFLMAVTIYFFVALQRRFSTLKALLLGAAVGFMFNVRGNSIVLAPVIPFLLFLTWRGLRLPARNCAMPIFVYAMGLVLSMGPFALRNWVASGEFVLSTPQSGFSLYMGFDPRNPDPYFRPVAFAAPSPYDQMVQMTIEASRRTGKKLTRKEASAYWALETKRFAFEQPAAFLKKTLLKTLVLFNRFEAGDHYSIPFISRFVPFFKLPLITLAMLLPFGMAGMVLCAWRSMRFFAVSLVFFFYGLTLIIFFTSTRFRLPLVLILIPFAVTGFRYFLSSIRASHWRKVVLYSFIFLSFSVIEFLPVRGTDDMTGYYNTHAIILSSKGRHDEAAKYWEASSKMNKHASAFANLSLAKMHAQNRETSKAMDFLERIPDNSFASAYKFDLLGDLMLSRGDLHGAIDAYETSLEINSGQRYTISKLIKIYWRTDRERAMKAFDRLEYVSSFYEASSTMTSLSGSGRRVSP